MSAARIPSSRPPGYIYGRPDIAALRVILDVHDAADCELPDRPAPRFRHWLTQLENTLAELGDDTRAQIWASLQKVSGVTKP